MLCEVCELLVILWQIQKNWRFGQSWNVSIISCRQLAELKIRKEKSPTTKNNNVKDMKSTHNKDLVRTLCALWQKLNAKSKCAVMRRSRWRLISNQGIKTMFMEREWKIRRRARCSFSPALLSCYLSFNFNWIGSLLGNLVIQNISWDTERGPKWLISCFVIILWRAV